MMGIEWHAKSPVLHKGDVAVDFFFVLSGFLLSYLAYFEFQKTNKIDIAGFFKRRVLRIFPLYYLAVVAGFLLLGVIFPKITGETFFSFDIGTGLIHYLLFLPNYVIAYGGDSIGSLYSLWSIGVEEQFYLFFPFLMIMLFRFKKVIPGLFILTILYFILYKRFTGESLLVSDTVMEKFMFTLKFHYMFTGAFFSLIFIHYNQIVRQWLNFKWVQLLIWIMVGMVFLTNYLEGLDMIEAIIFSLVIYAASHKPNKLLNLEIKPLIYLGMISYGIYIFHPLVSYPLRYVIDQWQLLFNLIVSCPIVYYILELCLTIGVAHISYRYYESYFLKKKQYPN